MKDPFDIRVAVATDAEKIKLIEKECGLSEWTLDDYRKAAVNPCFHMIVAVVRNDVIGFLLTRLITKEKALGSSNLSKTEAEILNLAVIKSMRMHGAGTALFRRLFEELLEYKEFSVFLEVRSANREARSFYISIGFRESGIRQDYYRNPTDDAILMTFSY